ncbi:MAG: class I SAM-dependent methyltransferase [Planctomycetaceae bacterium]
MTIPRVTEPEVMDTAEEAAAYDSMDHAAVNQCFVDDFLKFLQHRAPALRKTSPTVLDLGTGTALIPIQLRRDWPDCGPIAACDLSTEMLKLAQRNIESANSSGQVLPLFFDAKQMPVRDHSCDVVISNSIVHHIPEPALVFREIARVAKGGAAIFIRDLMRPETSSAVDHLVATHAGSENAFQQRMFRESLHAALTVDEVRELLAGAGFNSAWVCATTDRHWTISGIVES